MPAPTQAPPAVGLDGHERVRAVVHVQHGGLGPLEQDGLAPLQRRPQHRAGLRDVRAEPLRVGQVLLDDGVDLERLAVVDLEEHLVLLAQHQVELLAQDPRVEEILDPDAHAGHLVAVGRADAPPGGADPRRAEVALDDPVQGPVVRHDQVRVAGDAQPRDIHPALGQTVDLREQHLRVDDDPLPMTMTAFGERAPEGIRCRAYF